MPSVINQSYKDLYNYSISNGEEFWNEIAKEAVWSKPYTSVLENKSSHLPKWFVGGEINMSYNCLDRHILDGHGDDVAIIHDSPISGSTRSITYNQFLDSVSLLAGVLVDRCGLKKGDIVLLYFPVIPECLISMLACARIGVSYLVVYGGFADKELANRISHTEPKAVLTCSAGSEFGAIIRYKDKLDSALAISGFSPQYCLVFNRPNFKPANMVDKRDLDWTTELLKARPQESVPLSADHPLFLIFTSGTTGQPKCLVHLTGNAIVSNIYITKYVFCLTPKDTFWAFSNFGWIFGQSAMSYGALIMRYKSILYEGHIVGIPDNRQFARVLNWHKVTVMGCPTTILRLLQKHCSKRDLALDYKDMHTVYVGGEASDPSIRQWTSETFGCKLINAWGQSELCGGVSCNYTLFGDKNYTLDDTSSILIPPGLNFRVVDTNSGVDVPQGTLGRLVIKLPLSPALAGTFYKGEDRFYKTYFERFPGYYDTMDAGIILGDGWLKIVCRDDDVINVAAARICSTAVEEACVTSENISQALVIPLEDELLGHVPFAFLVRDAKSNSTDKEIIDESIKLVKNTIGELAKFNKAVIVPELPRTINGKAHRSCLIAMISGKTSSIPGMVVNGQVYQSIHEVLMQAGFKSLLPD